MAGKNHHVTHGKKKSPIIKILIAAVLISSISWGIYSLAFPKINLKWENGAKQTYLYKSKSVLDTFDFKHGGRSRVNSYLE